MQMEGPAKSVSAATTSLCAATNTAQQLVTLLHQASKSSRRKRGRIATLIVPQDVGLGTCVDDTSVAQGRDQEPQEMEDMMEQVRACAAALRQARAEGARVGVYIGGEALLQEGLALQNAALLADALGAELLCEFFFARTERGAGLPSVRRLPYFPEEAMKLLNGFDQLLLLDVPRPVAPFGFGNKQSEMVELPDESVWHLGCGCGAAALTLLLAELGIPDASAAPAIPRLAAAGRPTMPTGPLSALGVCQVLAAVQPEGAIIVDESVTTGFGYWEASKGCPPFTHLYNTGGAIGLGMPMALGAALACPGRPVINLEADGSAMYSLQALWSQAREGAHVITIICANNAYNILKVEAERMNIPRDAAVTRKLTDLSSPEINWVQLASGMGVHGCRVDTAEELAEQLRSALGRPGCPYLIQAMLPLPEPRS